MEPSFKLLSIYSSSKKLIKYYLPRTKLHKVYTTKKLSFELNKFKLLNPIDCAVPSTMKKFKKTAREDERWFVFKSK